MPEYAYVHNNEAEQAVLAACILNEEAAREIVAALEPEDFFRIVNGIIFDAAKTILSEGKRWTRWSSPTGWTRGGSWESR